MRRLNVINLFNILTTVSISVDFTTGKFSWLTMKGLALIVKHVIKP